MTWTEFMAARQFLVEERVGTAAREAIRAEDEQVRKSFGNVRRYGPR